jgi:PAS domain-containing protein
MNATSNAHLLTLGLAAMTCAALAAVGWRHRHEAGAVLFGPLMLAIAGWTVMYGLELAAAAPEVKLRWAELQYLCIPFVPVLWMLFLHAYASAGDPPDHRLLPLLLALPVLTALLAATNRYHGLVLREAVLDVSGPFAVLVRHFGWWFWVHTAYSYGLLAAGCLCLLQAVRGSPNHFHSQAGPLLLAGILPWIGNAVYIFGWSPLEPAIDPTPLSFTASGLLLAWAVFRGRLLDVVPIGHDAVIRSMPDSVILLDRFNRIIDLNPAARSLIGEQGRVIGRPAAELFGAWPHLVQRYGDTAELHEELELALGAKPRVLDVRISPILRSGRMVARLFLLRDITAHRQAQEEKLKSEKLKGALEMAGAVCHKLNQPIQGISGYAELLLLKIAPGDEGYQKVKRIKEQAERMGAITQKLMGITRYRTASYTLGETIVDIDRSAGQDSAEIEPPLPAPDDHAP